MKMAATGVFVLLCVMALALMRQESTGESLGETARQAMSSLMEQKLPDAVEEQSQTSTLVAEDKLEDALRQENAAAETVMAESGDGGESMAETASAESTAANAGEGEDSSMNGTEENGGGTSGDSSVTEPATAMTEDTEQNTTPDMTSDMTQTAEPPVAETTAAEVSSEPTTYTIRRGDTLIGISLRNYGSNGKVAEICSLNGITDPDDIKIGQKILLP